MMLKFTKLLGVAALLLALTACGNDVKESLGLSRVAPDEFTVVSRPALSVPPDFNLRPPRPGEPPRAPSMEDTAHGLLIGKTPTGAPQDISTLTQPTVDTAVVPVITKNQPTGAEASFMKKLGTDKAKDDIRAQLNTDAVTPADTSNAKTLMEKVYGAEKNEPVVDAKKESERLRSNKDEGKPANEGDVPNAEQKPPSLIDRIF